MKKRKYSLLIAISNFIAFAGLAISIPDDFKVIYGEDNREETYSSSVSNAINWGRSVAVQIPSRYIQYEFDGLLANIGYAKYGEAHYSCEDERFFDQNIVGKCTAFVIGKDLLLTAGHCIRSNEMCKGQSWAFDYHVSFSSFGDSSYVSGKDVYKCVELVSKELVTDAYYMDYAIVRVDREIVGRDTLKLSNGDKVNEENELAVIGYPLGLPQKISDNGFVIENDNPLSFKTDLDSYTGNSGSPVFNIETGLVEGMLTRGEDDFVWDETCSRSKVCESNECSGETVLRIDTIPELFPQKKNYYDQMKSELRSKYDEQRQDLNRMLKSIRRN